MASGYGTTSEAFTIDPRATEGTIGRRLLAYVVDIIVVSVIMMVLWVFIALVGLITFGFGWVLFALLPLTAIAYNAITIGGPSQATLGMRLAGVRMIDAASGGAVPMVTAAVHALLFYVALSTFLLWAIDIIVGLARADHRFGHDVLTGLAAIRSS